MIRFLLHYLIDNELGNYFEQQSLHGEHLKINALNGEVEIKNIDIRKDVFYSMGIFGLKILSGKIESIKVKIPWKKFNHESSKIIIRNVDIIIGPSSESDFPLNNYDPIHSDLNVSSTSSSNKSQNIRKKANWEELVKLQRLKALEVLKHAENVTDDEEEEADEEISPATPSSPKSRPLTSSTKDAIEIAVSNTQELGNDMQHANINAANSAGASSNNNILRKVSDVIIVRKRSASTSKPNNVTTKLKTTMKERLINKLLDNISICVENLKLSYRDDEKNISFGFQLDSFILETTDQDGNPAFIDRSKQIKTSPMDPSPSLFRCAQVKGFSIFADNYHSSSTSPASTTLEILKPLNFTASILSSADENASAAAGKNFPKTTVLVTIDSDILCSIDFDSLNTMNHILSQLSSTKEQIVHDAIVKQLRPNLRPDRKSAKLWWRYAIDLVLNAIQVHIRKEKRKRNKTGISSYSWNLLMDLLHDRSEYVALYKRKLLLIQKYGIENVHNMSYIHASDLAAGPVMIAYGTSNAASASASVTATTTTVAKTDAASSTAKKPRMFGLPFKSVMHTNESGSFSLGSGSSSAKVKKEHQKLQDDLEYYERKLPLDTIVLFRAFAEAELANDHLPAKQDDHFDEIVESKNGNSKNNSQSEHEDIQENEHGNSQTVQEASDEKKQGKKSLNPAKWFKKTSVKALFSRSTKNKQQQQTSTTAESNSVHNNNQERSQSVHELVKVEDHEEKRPHAGSYPGDNLHSGSISIEQQRLYESIVDSGSGLPYRFYSDQTAFSRIKFQSYIKLSQVSLKLLCTDTNPSPQSVSFQQIQMVEVHLINVEIEMKILEKGFDVQFSLGDMSMVDDSGLQMISYLKSDDVDRSISSPRVPRLVSACIQTFKAAHLRIVPKGAVRARRQSSLLVAGAQPNILTRNFDANPNPTAVAASNTAGNDASIDNKKQKSPAMNNAFAIDQNKNGSSLAPKRSMLLGRILSRKHSTSSSSSGPNTNNAKSKMQKSSSELDIGNAKDTVVMQIGNLKDDATITISSTAPVHIQSNEQPLMYLSMKKQDAIVSQIIKKDAAPSSQISCFLSAIKLVLTQEIAQMMNNNIESTKRKMIHASSFFSLQEIVIDSLEKSIKGKSYGSSSSSDTLSKFKRQIMELYVDLDFISLELAIVTKLEQEHKIKRSVISSIDSLLIRYQSANSLLRNHTQDKMDIDSQELTLSNLNVFVFDEAGSEYGIIENYSAKVNPLLLIAPQAHDTSAPTQNNDMNRKLVEKFPKLLIKLSTNALLSLLQIQKDFFRSGPLASDQLHQVSNSVDESNNHDIKKKKYKSPQSDVSNDQGLDFNIPELGLIFMYSSQVADDNTGLNVSMKDIFISSSISKKTLQFSSFVIEPVKLVDDTYVSSPHSLMSAKAMSIHAESINDNYVRIEGDELFLSWRMKEMNNIKKTMALLSNDANIDVKSKQNIKKKAAKYIDNKIDCNLVKRFEIRFDEDLVEENSLLSFVSANGVSLRLNQRSVSLNEPQNVDMQVDVLFKVPSVLDLWGIHLSPDIAQPSENELVNGPPTYDTNLPVFEIIPPEPESFINLSLMKSHESAVPSVKVRTRSIQYTHLHTLMKEFVDYMEKVITPFFVPPSDTMAVINLDVLLENSSLILPPLGLSRDKNAMNLIKDNIVVVTCETAVGKNVIKRSYFQDKENSSQNSEEKKEQRIDDVITFQVTTCKLFTKYPSQVTAPITGDPIDCKITFTRTNFSSKEASSRREKILSNPSQNIFFFGVRDLFPPPSGIGTRLRMDFDFSISPISKRDHLHLFITKEQVHLFFIILSENFRDWRKVDIYCTKDDRKIDLKNQLVDEPPNWSDSLSNKYDVDREEAHRDDFTVDEFYMTAPKIRATVGWFPSGVTFNESASATPVPSVSESPAPSSSNLTSPRISTAHSSTTDLGRYLGNFNASSTGIDMQMNDLKEDEEQDYELDEPWSDYPCVTAEIDGMKLGSLSYCKTGRELDIDILGQGKLNLLGKSLIGESLPNFANGQEVEIIKAVYSSSDEINSSYFKSESAFQDNSDDGDREEGNANSIQLGSIITLRKSVTNDGDEYNTFKLHVPVQASPEYPLLMNLITFLDYLDESRAKIGCQNSRAKPRAVRWDVEVPKVIADLRADFFKDGIHFSETNRSNFKFSLESQITVGSLKRRDKSTESSLDVSVIGYSLTQNQPLIQQLSTSMSSADSSSASSTRAINESIVIKPFSIKSAFDSRYEKSSVIKNYEFSIDKVFVDLSISKAYALTSTLTKMQQRFGVQRQSFKRYALPKVRDISVLHMIRLSSIQLFLRGDNSQSLLWARTSMIELRQNIHGIAEEGKVFTTISASFIAPKQMSDRKSKSASAATPSAYSTPVKDYTSSAAKETIEQDSISTPTVPVNQFITDQDDDWGGSKSKFGLYVESFNASLMKWEPLLEPWMFSASIEMKEIIQYTSDIRPPNQISLTLNTKEMFNFNISFAGVDTLSKILYCPPNFQDPEKQLQSRTPTLEKTSDIGDEYIFANDCGVPVSFHVVKFDASDGDTLYVKPTESIKFSFKTPKPKMLETKLTTPKKNRHSMQHSLPEEMISPVTWLKTDNYISISFAPQENSNNNDHDEDHRLPTMASSSFQTGSSKQRNWHDIENVPINKVGTYVYPLYPRIDPTSVDTFDRPRLAYVAIEISSTPNGNYKIRLSTTVDLINNTSVPIQVLLLPESDPTQQFQVGEAVLLDPVAGNGGTVAIPIEATSHRFSIRPILPNTNEDDYLWWEGVPLSSLKTLRTGSNTSSSSSSQITDNSMVIKCKHYNLSNVSFSCVLTLKDSGILKSNEQGSAYNQGTMKIVIDQLIKVENFLPVQLDFRLLSIIPADMSSLGVEHSVVLSEDTLAPGSSGGGYQCDEVQAKTVYVSFSVGTDNENKQIWSTPIKLVDFTDLGETSSNIGDNFGINQSRNPVVVDDVKMTMTKKVTVFDNEGNKISLSIVRDKSESGIRSFNMYVYAKAWFLNLTGLDLGYKAGSSTHMLEEVSRKIRPVIQRRTQSRTLKMANTASIQKNLVAKSQDADHDGETDDGVEVFLDEQDSKDISKKNNENGTDVVVNSSNSNGNGNSSASESNEKHPSTTSFYVSRSAMDDLAMFSESNTLSIKVSESSWSSPFSLDKLGTRGVLQVKRSDNEQDTSDAIILGDYYTIGLTVGLAPQVFRQSKVITFVPRFWVINNIPDRPLYVSRMWAGERIKVKFEPGQSCPLHIGSATPTLEHALVSFGFEPGDSWTFSGPIDLTVDGETAVRMYNSETFQVIVIRVLVYYARQATSKVIISYDDEEEPIYRVVNKTNEVIHFVQKLSNQISSLSTVKQSVQQEPIIERLKPNEKKPFGWQFPNDSAKLIEVSFTGGSQEKVILQFDNVGYSYVIKDRPGKVRGSSIKLSVRIQKSTKELLIFESIATPTSSINLQNPDNEEINHDDDRAFALRAVTSSRSPKRGRRRTQQHYQQQGQHSKEKSKSSMSSTYIIDLLVHFNGIGLSVIDSYPQEMIYTVFENVSFTYLQQPPRGDKSIQLMMGSMQIDNQLLNTRMPFMLRPLRKYYTPSQSEFSGMSSSASSSTSSNDNVPFFQFGVVERANESSDCRIFESIALRIQEFDLNIEESMFLLLARFFLEANEVVTHHRKAYRDDHLNYMQLKAVGDQNTILKGIIRESSIQSDIPSVNPFSKLKIQTKDSGTNASMEIESQNSSSLQLDKKRNYINSTTMSSATSSSDQSNNQNDPNSNDLTVIEAWIMARKNMFLQTMQNPSKEVKQKLFFEKLIISPITINITFQMLVEDGYKIISFPRWRGPGSDQAYRNRNEYVSFTGFNEKTSKYEYSSDHEFDPSKVLSMLPPALTNIDRAVFSLDALEITKAYITSDQLLNALARDYGQKSLSQVYSMIGSSEILGNPIGLVTSLGSGVGDFFYEPAQAIMDARSPADFGNGVARGTRSLLHNTAYSAFDTMSKISGALGSGVALLSLDPKYLATRRLSMLEERPQGVGDGLALAAKSVSLGLVKGVSGLVIDPIIGAGQEGAAGFVKGVGRGIVGVAVKPVVGIFDMVARFFAGIRSTAETLGGIDTTRRWRLPRTLHSESRLLRVFDPNTAFLQELLINVWGVKRYREVSNRSYQFLPLPGNLVLVISFDRISCIDYTGYIPSNSIGKRAVQAAASAAMSKKMTCILVWEVLIRGILDVFPKSSGHEIVVVLAFPTAATAAFFAASRYSGKITLYDSVKMHGISNALFNGKSALVIPAPDHQTAVMFLNQLLMSISPSESGDKKNLSLIKKNRRGFGITIHQYHGPSSVPSNILAKGNGMGPVPLPDPKSCGVCLISQVTQGSRAEKCGFQPFDLIIGFGGRSMEVGDDGRSLVNAIENIPSRSCLDVVVWRRGRRYVFLIEFE